MYFNLLFISTLFFLKNPWCGSRTHSMTAANADPPDVPERSELYTVDMQLNLSHMTY